MSINKHASHEESPHDTHEDDSHGSHGSHEHGSGNLELGFALLSGVLLLIGWIVSRTMGEDVIIVRGLYAAACLAGAWFTVREAIENLRKRRLQIDTLMLVAAAGAIALGHWGKRVCCCSCSVWDIRSKTMQWAVPVVRSKPWRSCDLRPHCGAARNWSKPRSKRCRWATS